MILGGLVDFYRNKEQDSESKFAAVCEAYDVLSSPKWKSIFDQFGADAMKKGVPMPPIGNKSEGPVCAYTFHGDALKVFREFFGLDCPFADFFLPNLDTSFKFFEGPAKPAQGPDEEFELSLSLEEAYHGCTKTVSVPLRVVDDTGTKTVEMEKSFTFRVPKGTRNEHMFHFSSAGTSGPNMLPGNVTFRTRIEPHLQFRLEDTNFVVSKTIHLGYALLGCTVDVSTFDGKTIHLPISDIIKPGHRIALKGEGMPIIGLAAKGDLLIEFDVLFPEQLSKNQKKLIQEALIKSNK